MLYDRPEEGEILIPQIPKTQFGIEEQKIENAQNNYGDVSK